MGDANGAAPALTAEPPHAAEPTPPARIAIARVERAIAATYRVDLRRLGLVHCPALEPSPRGSGRSS